MTAAGSDRRPGDRLVRSGVVIFAVGLVAILVDVLPFFFGASNLPTALDAAAGVLPPLGFGLALLGLLRSARRSRRGSAVAAQR